MELWDILDADRNPTGRKVVRGQPMSPDEYHLVVHIWITDGRGNFLISKRTPNKTFPNMWETTGGSVTAGENSLQGALREAGEELGIRLNPDDGRLFKSITRVGGMNNHTDIWLFTGDVDTATLNLQPEEVSAARWATKAEIKGLLSSGEFVDVFTYMDELFDSIP